MKEVLLNQWDVEKMRGSVDDFTTTGSKVYCILAISGGKVHE